MAKNYIGPGRYWPVTAAADVVANDFIFVGAALFGVCQGSALTGETVVIDRQGVYTLRKTSGDDIAVGDIAYWDAGNEEFTKVATANTRVGVFMTAAGVGVATVQVSLGVH